MRYIASKKLLFIHIPKTGGVSIEDLIYVNFKNVMRLKHHWRGLPGRHITPKQLRENYWVPIIRNEMRGFAFVRHPVAWYKSAWRWFQDVQKNREGYKNKPYAALFKSFKWHPKKPLLPLSILPFDEFIFQVTELHPGFLSDLYQMYLDDPAISFVGRTETLDVDARTILELESNVKVPRLNASMTPAPVVAKNSDVEKAILDSEKRAIDQYYSTDTIKYRHVKDWK